MAVSLRTFPILWTLFFSGWIPIPHLSEPGRHESRKYFTHACNRFARLKRSQFHSWCHSLINTSPSLRANQKECSSTTTKERFVRYKPQRLLSSATDSRTFWPSLTLSIFSISLSSAISLVILFVNHARKLQFLLSSLLQFLPYPHFRLLPLPLFPFFYYMLASGGYPKHYVLCTFANHPIQTVSSLKFELAPLSHRNLLSFSNFLLFWSFGIIVLLNAVTLLILTAILQFLTHLFHLWPTNFICRMHRTTVWSSTWIPTSSSNRWSTGPRPTLLVGYSR